MHVNMHVYMHVNEQFLHACFYMHVLHACNMHVKTCMSDFTGSYFDQNDSNKIKIK
jgi:hypothetical protein